MSFGVNGTLKTTNTRCITNKLRQGVPCSAKPGDGGVISVVGSVNILLDRAGVFEQVRDIASGKERLKVWTDKKLSYDLVGCGQVVVPKQVIDEY